VDSVASLPAKPGDGFAINVRIRVGIDQSAQPELVCFDAQGKEIAPPAVQANRQSTTNWQMFNKTFIALPKTAMVRARIRGYNPGNVLLDALTIRPVPIDTYQTGMLVARPHPRTRSGILLESNFGIVNRDLVTSTDRDGDGKWALVVQDLDRLTQPAEKGIDWRSNWEDNPNVILWTDGAVLKSDSVTADRAPDASHALHFRMKVHAGPYVHRLAQQLGGQSQRHPLDGRRCAEVRFRGCRPRARREPCAPFSHEGPCRPVRRPRERSGSTRRRLDRRENLEALRRRRGDRAR
jgi:hypothetical protein